MFRIGHGIDVHQFAYDRALILGGVKLSDIDGLIGHSDADVLTHAIMDAILGAVGGGDIGEHFPDTDAQYLNADSKELLRRLWERVHADGWEIVNLDCTIIAQKPRIAPFKQAIKLSVAEALLIDESVCGIKATTTEHLGFLGREEGMAAFAVVLLEKTTP